MYAIKHNGETVQYCEAFCYCYKLKSGSPQIVRDKERATGVFVSTNVYNLNGHEDFDAPQVTVEQIDGASAIGELETDLEEAYELLYGGGE